MAIKHEFWSQLLLSLRRPRMSGTLSYTQWWIDWQTRASVKIKLDRLTQKSNNTRKVFAGLICNFTLCVEGLWWDLIWKVRVTNITHNITYTILYTISYAITHTNTHTTIIIFDFATFKLFSLFHWIYKVELIVSVVHLKVTNTFNGICWYCKKINRVYHWMF